MTLFPSSLVGTSLWGTGFNFLSFTSRFSRLEMLCLISASPVSVPLCVKGNDSEYLFGCINLSVAVWLK